MRNIAEVKIGVIVVSRDCFPVELAQKRRGKVVEECSKKQIPVTKLETVIEHEEDTLKALDEIKAKDINALVIYLGNFGPEGPLTMLAQKFAGPVMLCAAAEETQDNLFDGRGDAYCGMLNASYSLNLRKVNAHIPEYPVGIAPEIANMIKDFIPVARVIISLKNLKLFSFGPRPEDFLVCNAPIKPLFDLGVEIMENSELDLYDIFLKSADDPAVDTVAKEMAAELMEGNTYPELLKKLAQYEVALTKFYEDNLGASEFGVFANKCWPAFESYFGFVPCFVNSRLASKGIPVACEVDIYGALSEYIATAATELPVTLLDINNNVPYDMFEGAKATTKNYKLSDLFIGFHCGNTPSSCMIMPSLRYQLIMKRLLEGEREPDITRGTLEGRIKPGELTILRLQSTADVQLKAYVAEGEILDIDPKSFGGIGVFAIPEMGRFYRRVLLEKQFPHHTVVAFRHVGKTIFNVFKMLGVKDISFNLPKGAYYEGENPFL
jgi:L-fucose isomerase-like protein